MVYQKICLPLLTCVYRLDTFSCHYCILLDTEHFCYGLKLNSQLHFFPKEPPRTHEECTLTPAKWAWKTIVVSHFSPTFRVERAYVRFWISHYIMYLSYLPFWETLDLPNVLLCFTKSLFRFCIFKFNFITYLVYDSQVWVCAPSAPIGVRLRV